VVGYQRLARSRSRINIAGLLRGYLRSVRFEYQRTSVRWTLRHCGRADQSLDQEGIYLWELEKVIVLILIRKSTLSNKYEGAFGKFMDWWQCVAVMQRKAVAVMPSCSGGGNVVVV